MTRRQGSSICGISERKGIAAPLACDGARKPATETSRRGAGLLFLSELVVVPKVVPATVMQVEKLIRSFRMPHPLPCARSSSPARRTSRSTHNLASYATIGKYTRVGKRLARVDVAQRNASGRIHTFLDLVVRPTRVLPYKTPADDHSFDKAIKT